LDFNLLEEKYLKNGINNFKLKSLEDLKVVHGIDILKIEGINKLAVNRGMFEGFLINFFNRWGLEARNTIKPLWVEYCNDKSNGRYLKFVYEMYGNKKWLHVKDFNTWY